ALALSSIKPIVTHKPLRTLNDWYEFLAYPAVNLCTVLWIKVIMTNDGEHDASPSFNVPVSTLFWEDDLCVAFRVELESAMRVPKTQSIFHLRTQRNAFRPDAPRPSRSVLLENRRLRPNPNSIRLSCDCQR